MQLPAEDHRTVPLPDWAYHPFNCATQVHPVSNNTLNSKSSKKQGNNFFFRLLRVRHWTFPHNDSWYPLLFRSFVDDTITAWTWAPLPGSTRNRDPPQHGKSPPRTPR